MDVAAKLQLKEGQKVRVLNAPKGVKLDVAATQDAKAEAVLLFITSSKDLKAAGKPFVTAAREDRLAWLAYPKAGQLGTDVNRDTLWEMTEPMGIRPVRQVSIDATWSALRFRPA